MLSCQGSVSFWSDLFFGIFAKDCKIMVGKLTTLHYLRMRNCSKKGGFNLFGIFVCLCQYLKIQLKNNKLGNQLDLTVFYFWVLTTCFFGNSEASLEAAPLPQLPPEPPRHGFENFLVLTELVVNVFGVPEFVFFCWWMFSFEDLYSP